MTTKYTRSCQTSWSRSRMNQLTWVSRTTGCTWTTPASFRMLLRAMAMQARRSWKKWRAGMIRKPCFRSCSRAISNWTEHLFPARGTFRISTLSLAHNQKSYSHCYDPKLVLSRLNKLSYQTLPCQRWAASKWYKSSMSQYFQFAKYLLQAGKSR